MKHREVTGCKWVAITGEDAITIYPFSFFREANPPEWLRTHERIHVAQVRRDGWWRFYASYIWQYLRGRWRRMGHDAAYRAIGYEAEAYAHQDEPDYPSRVA